MTTPYDPNQQQSHQGGHGADPYGQPYPSQYGPDSPQPGQPYHPYGHPGYGRQPPPGTSGMAVAALITSAAGLLLCGITCPVGAILGHVALNRIKQTGQQGRGLALAGIIIGWVGTVLLMIGVILVIATVNSVVGVLEDGLPVPA
jgi:hypothetical protein